MTGLTLDHIAHADALTYLKTLPDACVNLCVTSPPYLGLRSYLPDSHADKAQEVGTEDTPAAYIARLVDVFREVRRVLRDDGNCYVNLGDSYAAGATGNIGTRVGVGMRGINAAAQRPDKSDMGYPPKSLMLIPHRFAIAMQDDGWICREDICWSKPNPMPESVKDRCTRAHEYIFHFTKSPRYWYDAQAVAEGAVEYAAFKRNSKKRLAYSESDPERARYSQGAWGIVPSASAEYGTRNRRSVWTISPANFANAHFATFPEAIPEIIIKAACPEGGVALDPFMGAGTVGLVAKRLNRRYIGCDLNAEYVRMAEARIDSIPYTLFSLMEVAK